MVITYLERIEWIEEKVVLYIKSDIMYFWVTEYSKANYIKCFWVTVLAEKAGDEGTNQYLLGTTEIK